MRRLLIRPGAIGDFIVSIPALQFLRTNYTEIWCSGPNVPLAAMVCDHATSIISAGLDRVGILNDADVLERLAQFDDIHSWYGIFRPDFRTSVASLPFHFYPPLPRLLNMHATEFYCGQTGAPVRPPELPTRAERKAFTVIHPFASNPLKRWPIELFRRLAENLAPAEWCAGPEEQWDGARRIEDLGRLAHWLASASLFVGNDSGITHLAAAVGTPSVAIFGPTNPAVWAPLGGHVRVVQRSPLSDLPPERALAAAQSLL